MSESVMERMCKTVRNSKRSFPSEKDLFTFLATCGLFSMDELQQHFYEVKAELKLKRMKVYRR